MPSHAHFLWKDLFQFAKNQKQSLIDVLKQNILFSTLNSRELRYLANFIYERVYEPNEAVFRQNDRGFGMYIIVKGRVAIKTQSLDREMLVTMLEQGSFFGELSLVEPESLRTATAEAAERSIIIGFFKPDLLEILERKPEMGVKILLQLSKVLGRRLSETTEKITAMAQAKASGRRHEDNY